MRLPFIVKSFCRELKLVVCIESVLEKAEKGSGRFDGGLMSS